MSKDVRAGWACPYCKKFYEKYSDADTCAKECVMPDVPIRATQEIYFCRYCRETVEYNCINKDKCNWKSDHCEKNHEEHQDKFWQEYTQQISKKKLAMSAMHQEQARLQ